MGKLKGNGFRFCIKRNDKFSHIYTVKKYKNGEVIIYDDCPNGQAHITIHSSGEVHWGPQKLNNFFMSAKDRHNIQAGICPTNGGRKIMYILLPVECAVMSTYSSKDELQIIDTGNILGKCVVITFVETRNVDILKFDSTEAKILGTIRHTDERVLTVLYFQTSNYTKLLFDVNTKIKLLENDVKHSFNTEITSKIIGGVATVEINGIYGFVDMRGVSSYDVSNVLADNNGNIFNKDNIHINKDYCSK